MEFQGFGVYISRKPNQNFRYAKPIQFKDLPNANNISDQIWGLIKNWIFFEKDTIGRQMVRSADSISANIAEGYGRFHFKDSKRFYFYSRGSLLETINWLEKCERRNLIPSQHTQRLITDLHILHKQLNAFIKLINQSTY